jgi:hypothetical protein
MWRIDQQLYTLHANSRQDPAPEPGAPARAALDPADGGPHRGTLSMPVSLSTTIIGSPIIDDIFTNLAAEALALAQQNSADKAENAALSTLAATVSTKAEQSALALKADQSALTTLTATVAGKVEQSALPLRADNSTLAALVATVATKANQSATTNALALKVDLTALTALAATVASKAEQTALSDASTSINNHSDSISALQTGSFGATYWITSPDYDLGPHPDKNLAVR